MLRSFVVSAPRCPLAHALAALAHPVCVAAVALLLLNDHLLKAAWPGWLTGKLSDVAGLAFAPLLVALPLALLPTARRGDRWLLWLAMAATGLWFAAAKTVPAVHEASLAVLSALTGGPFWFQRDPSDLLALPGLLVAHHCWRTTAVARAATGPRPNGWLVAGVALLACVATTPAALHFGVSCFRSGDTLLVAVDGEWPGWFSTADGGLTWGWFERFEPRHSFKRVPQCHAPEVLVDPSDGRQRYRVLVDDRVDVSTDGGQTWRTDLNLRPYASPGRRVRMDGEPGQHTDRAPLPLDAALDPASRNLVLSMGPEGALVRRVDDGGWQWANVGEYAYARPAGYDPRLLGGEWLAAVAVPFLVAISMTGLFRHRRITAFACGVGMVAWACYAAGVVQWRSEGRDTFTMPFLLLGGCLGMVTCVLLPGLTGLTAMFIAGHGGREWLWRSLLGVALWMAPYLLWLEGSIISYPVAAGMAVLLTVLNLAAAYHAYAHWFAEAPPAAPPADVDVGPVGRE